MPRSISCATQDLVGSPEIVKKVTERWELADNLLTHTSARKQIFGTRYSFGDTYGVMIERGIKKRVYPATDDGTLDGSPVLMTETSKSSRNGRRETKSIFRSRR